MSGIDKIFGLILMIAGFSIAIYWTIWQFLSLPVINRRNTIYNYFLEPYYLFTVPSLALIAGLLLIDTFIARTNKRIADEKAKKEREDAKKK